MPIPVTCPHCHLTFHFKDRYEGVKGACPNCKGTIQVPKLPAAVAEDEDSDLHVLSLNAQNSIPMKTCEKCGKSNPSDSTECFFCGAAV